MAKLELDNLQHKVVQRATLPNYPGYHLTAQDLAESNLQDARFLVNNKHLSGQHPEIRVAIANQITTLIRLADHHGYKVSEIVADHFNATSNQHKVDIHIPR